MFDFVVKALGLRKLDLSRFERRKLGVGNWVLFGKGQMGQVKYVLRNRVVVKDAKDGACYDLSVSDCRPVEAEAA